MNVFHHASLLTIALLACACRVSSIAVPLAPPGVHVRPEVARGYLTYEAPLAAYGDWAPDRDYGVHWCPSATSTGGRDVPFQPYVNRGHWDLSETAIGKAPAGSPVWRSEDSDTWGEITTHHGWWIPARGESGWCWVPGLEETPASVAWREDEEFVGWAALLPFWVAVDEVDYDNGLDWVYTLVATLMDGSVGDNLLSGKAKDQARAATGPVRGRDGSFRQQHVGPSGAKIGAAKQVLAAYVRNHPDAIAAATANQGSRGSASSGGSHAKSSSSSSSAKQSEGKDGISMSVGMAPMPYAMTYYEAFQAEPLVGPAATTARGGATGQAMAARDGAEGRGGTSSAAGGGEARSASLHGEGAAAARASSREAHATAAAAPSYRYSSAGKSGKGRSGGASRSSKSSKSRR